MQYLSEFSSSALSESLFWSGLNVRCINGSLKNCQNKHCTDAGSFRCLIPSSPISLSVLQLCRYALQTTSSYIYYLYPSYELVSSSLYWLGCTMIDWLYFIVSKYPLLTSEIHALHGCRKFQMFDSFIANIVVCITIVQICITNQLFIYLLSVSII